MISPIVSRHLIKLSHRVRARSFEFQALCVGSFDRIRVFSWSGRKNLWEENAAKEIKYLYRLVCRTTT